VILLVVLLLLSVALMGVTAFMVRRIAGYRRQQASDYQALAETELTTVKF